MSELPPPAAVAPTNADAIADAKISPGDDYEEIREQVRSFRPRMNCGFNSEHELCNMNLLRNNLLRKFNALFGFCRIILLCIRRNTILEPRLLSTQFHNSTF